MFLYNPHYSQNPVTRVCWLGCAYGLRLQDSSFDFVNFLLYQNAVAPTRTSTSLSAKPSSWAHSRPARWDVCVEWATSTGAHGQDAISFGRATKAGPCRVSA